MTMLKEVRSALIDADHLAECSERLLAALNKKAGAEECVSATDTCSIEAQELADLELNQANEEVSEYWNGVKSASYEYRKRAERARKAIEEVAKSKFAEILKEWKDGNLGNTEAMDKFSALLQEGGAA